MRRRRAGFTLLEMIITLAILAMVMGMLGGILLSVIDTHKRIERKIKPNKIGPSILALMARDIQGLYAYDVELCFVGVDEGEQDELHFVTTRASAPQAETGTRTLVTEVGYALQERGEEAGFFTLFRRESPGMDDDPLTGGTFTPLYPNVTALDVKYLSHDENADWQDAWPADAGPPAAVWIYLTVAPEYERGSGDPNDPEPGPKTYTTVVTIPIQPATPIEFEEEEGEGESGGESGGGESGGGEGGGAPPPPPPGG